MFKFLAFLLINEYGLENISRELKPSALLTLSPTENSELK